VGSADWKNPLTKLTVACEKICRMPDLNKLGRKPRESSAPAEVIRQSVDVMKLSILLYSADQYDPPSIDTSGSRELTKVVVVECGVVLVGLMLWWWRKKKNLEKKEEEKKMQKIRGVARVSTP
jgi:hypothetical protein